MDDDTPTPTAGALRSRGVWQAAVGTTIARVAVVVSVMSLMFSPFGDVLAETVLRSFSWNTKGILDEAVRVIVGVVIAAPLWFVLPTIGGSRRD